MDASCTTAVAAHLLLFHFLDRLIPFGVTGSSLEPIAAGAQQKYTPARVLSSAELYVSSGGFGTLEHGTLSIPDLFILGRLANENLFYFYVIWRLIHY